MKLTPSSVNSKRRLDSRSPNWVTKIIRNSNSPKKNVSANRFSELSSMDIDVAVSQTVTPNRTEKSSTSTSNNNVVNTNVGNNKKHSQPTGSQGQLPSHKPPPIMVDHCENLNGLIRSTDKIVEPSKYFLKCHPNNSVSILAADPNAYRAITKSLTLKKCHSIRGS